MTVMCWTCPVCCPPFTVSVPWYGERDKPFAETVFEDCIEDHEWMRHRTSR